jgi:hypothetical protein
MTLFPFLAVLICTMGSLIVLLVVMVQQAKASAVDVSRQRTAQQAQQQQQRTQQQEQLQREQEDLQWQLHILRGSRAQTAEQLEDRRRELSHLEDVIRDLEQQLKLVVAEAEQMKQHHPLDRDSLADAQQRIEQLKREIDQTRQEIEATRLRLETQEVSYAIVPYEGPHGTHRRPIFVECLEDRIVLQPEGIELLSEDFREPITDDNPLASALRAKREYLADVLREEDDHPYPLLVVRPEGARAYAAARAAMKSWQAEFGYELVDAALPLEYPVADPALTALMRRAVDQARARRKYLQSIAPARFGRPDSVLRPSHQGGFERQPAASSGPAPASLGEPDAFAQSDRITDETDAAGGTDNWSGIGPEPEVGGAGESESWAADRASSALASGNPLGNPSATADSFSNEATATGGRQTDFPSDGSGAGQPGSQGAPAATRANAQVSGSPKGPTSPSAVAGSGGPMSVGGSEALGPGAGGALPSPSFSAAGNLSETRGRDWALPENALGATGITRPIRIACHSDRLVLLPEDRAKEKLEVLRVEGQLQDQVDELVSRVWQRVETWGIAGPGMYWKPVLVAEVAPSGEQRYVELARLLHDSGITVKRKP